MKTLLTTACILLVQCGLAQAPSLGPRARKAIEARLGSGVTYTPNQNQTFVLAVKVNQQAQWKEKGVKQLLIYDLKAHKITFYDQIRSGDASWYSNAQVRLKIYPEVGFKNAGLKTVVYLIEAKSGRRQKL